MGPGAIQSKRVDWGPEGAVQGLGKEGLPRPRRGRLCPATGSYLISQPWAGHRPDQLCILQKYKTTKISDTEWTA